MTNTQSASALDLYPDISCDILKADVKSDKPGIKMGKKRNAFLRKDGRWETTAKINGKKKSCYGKTAYKAIMKADIAEAEAAKDQDTLDRITGSKMYQFENVFLRFRNFKLFMGGVTPETVDRYEVTYNRYFPNSLLATMDIRQIDSTVVSNFFVRIIREEKKMTTREFQRIKHIVKATIDFAYDEELDDVPPNEINKINWDKVRRRTSEHGKLYSKKRQQYAVSVPEKDILKHKILDEKVYQERFASVLMLLINFSLGLRVGELAALKEEDVDMQRHVVYVNGSVKTYKKRDEYGNTIGGAEHVVGEPKTSNGKRVIPMSYTAQQLFTILFAYRKERGFKSPYLVYDGVKIRAKSKMLGHILKELCKRTDIEEFTSHVIRKSFATALSCNPEIDIATISQYLGHAQVSTTVNNYIIPARESLENRIAQMSKMV